MMKKLLIIACMAVTCLHEIRGMQPGPNHNMPKPNGITATRQGDKVVITGTVGSLPNSSIIIQFFQNPTIESNGAIDADRIIGQIGLTINASGKAVIEDQVSEEERTFLVDADAKYISATSTRMSDDPAFQRTASQGLETSQVAVVSGNIQIQ